MRGHCLCKKIIWEASTSSIWQGFCHCESCRRASSAPMVAWIGFARDDVNFSAPPKEFCSSEGVVRGFCGDCGSPMFFQSEKWPDEIHLYAASLNDPSRANPTTHYFFSQRLEWVEIEDELEKQG